MCIQLRRLGDILLTTPAISYLKKQYPQASIDYLSEPIGKLALQKNPNLNDVLIYDSKNPIGEIKRIRSKKYDVIFDFMGNPRTAVLSRLSSAKLRVGFPHHARSFFYNLKPVKAKKPEYNGLRKVRLIQAWLNKLGQPTPEPMFIRPQLFLTDEDEKYAQEWIKEQNMGSSPFVVLAPASRIPTRRWGPDGFRDLGLDLYRKMNIKVYYAWGPSEEGLIQSIRDGYENELKMLPATNIRQMAAIIKRAQFVVSLDSGVMHIAVAMNTSTVTIYGPTRPIDWNPSLTDEAPTVQNEIVQVQNLDCLGCHLNECPIGHYCMKRLSKDDVFRFCEQILVKEAK
ncbi:hypothetical protein BVX98_06490 [bacterium F11]|nr:hypothetical protein BVX98_06490 [bacterium F11]